MNKLTLLDELITMFNNGEIVLRENQSIYTELLFDIKQIVEGALYDEIIRDITNMHTEYFAPEYDTWKSLLADCDGTEDYKVMLENFEEYELEQLWQNSHITHEYAEDQIKQEIIMQICKLKKLKLMERKSKQICKGLEPQNDMSMIVARIKGLYEMLYE